MLVTFHCAHCNAKLRINANAMGTSLHCPECGGEIEVPTLPLGPGFVVGGFLIKHKIGEGGMGEVYLARQLSMERDVALKILPARFTRESSFVVRFLREVHCQARMDHPNIVTAYDAGEDNGVYFMAMQYVNGETLEEWLNREGAMAESDALQVVKQAAIALQYAAGQGILHRDIKPANIMVVEGMGAKILDMGLSKNTMERNSQTHADTLMGTPNYMSPEQIERPQAIDTRSDLFSLGMTLYHMLTGRVPYEDSSYLNTLRRHGQEQLEDPRELMPGISRGVVLLLARMLAKDPEDRFATWDGFLAALRHVQSGRGPFPQPPDGPGHLRISEVLEAPPPPRVAPPPPPAPVAPPASPPPDRRLSGVLVSIVLGLILGFMGIAGLLRFSSPSETAPPPLPVPTVRPTALPPEATVSPVAVAVPEGLSKRLTELILAYEREPGRYDEVLLELVEIGELSQGTALADRAAQQVQRVRRDREAAILEATGRLRETVLRILQQEGGEAARAHLENYGGPWAEQMATARGWLRRRIEQWESQERAHQEAERQVARDRYLELLDRVAALLLQPDLAQALQLVDDAAGDAAYFGAATEVGALRRELTALQGVPREILESYRPFLNQEIPIQIRGGGVQITRLKEIRPEGLFVARTLYGPDGEVQGTVDRWLALGDLSVRERMERMEGMVEPRHNLYRALMAQQNFSQEACRHFLAAADTDLARALSSILFQAAPRP